jgi:hypothetical protein
VFAFPQAEKASLEIRWRSGKTTVLEDVISNHRYSIAEK